jgi:hypothetical protein
MALSVVRRQSSAQNVIKAHGGRAAWRSFGRTSRPAFNEGSPAPPTLAVHSSHRAADSSRVQVPGLWPSDLALRTGPQPPPRHREHNGAHPRRKPIAACSAQTGVMTMLMPAGPEHCPTFSTTDGRNSPMSRDRTARLDKIVYGRLWAPPGGCNCPDGGGLKGGAGL